MAARADGFTFPELLACLGTLSICMVLAAPAFSALRDRMQAQATLHSLTATLSAARLAAVSRRLPVSVCPSRDGIGCRLDRVWDQGWIAFVDPARTGQPSGPDDVIRHEPGIHGISIRSSAGRHRVRFHPSGFATGNNLTLTLCVERTAAGAGSVIVNLSGRPRMQRTPNGTPCAHTP